MAPSTAARAAGRDGPAALGALAVVARASSAASSAETPSRAKDLCAPGDDPERGDSVLHVPPRTRPGPPATRGGTQRPRVAAAHAGEALLREATHPVSTPRDTGSGIRRRRHGCHALSTYPPSTGSSDDNRSHRRPRPPGARRAPHRRGASPAASGFADLLGGAHAASPAPPRAPRASRATRPRSRRRASPHRTRPPTPAAPAAGGETPAPFVLTIATPPAAAPAAVPGDRRGRARPRPARRRARADRRRRRLRARPVARRYRLVGPVPPVAVPLAATPGSWAAPAPDCPRRGPRARRRGPAGVPAPRRGARRPRRLRAARAPAVPAGSKASACPAGRGRRPRRSAPRSGSGAAARRGRSCGARPGRPGGRRAPGAAAGRLADGRARS